MDSSGIPQLRQLESEFSAAEEGFREAVESSSHPGEVAVARIDALAKLVAFNQARTRHGLPDVTVDYLETEQEKPVKTSHIERPETEQASRSIDLNAEHAPLDVGPITIIPETHQAALRAAEKHKEEPPSFAIPVMAVGASPEVVSHEFGIEALDYVMRRVSIAKVPIPQNHAELRLFRAKLAQIPDLEGKPDDWEERFFTLQARANRRFGS